MEVSPKHIDVSQVQAEISSIPGVVEVYDLHIWTIANGRKDLSVPVVVGMSLHNKVCFTDYSGMPEG